MLRRPVCFWGAAANQLRVNGEADGMQRMGLFGSREEGMRGGIWCGDGDELLGCFQGSFEMGAPWFALPSSKAGAGPHNRFALVFILLCERIGQKCLVVGTKVGGRGEDPTQAQRGQQSGLESQACVLEHVVTVALIVESPVDPIEALRATDQEMAELVKDHLSEAIVWIQIRLVAEQQSSGAVGRRIAVGSPLDAETDGAGCRYPNFVERIDVADVDRARHGRTVAYVTPVRGEKEGFRGMARSGVNWSPLALCQVHD